MASLLPQRELLASFKQETLMNLKSLHLLYPLPDELSRALFKDGALEKLTQNVFINLSHYLVSIISPKLASALPWPLYDSKSERAYKNELASLIAQYEITGLVSPIMSSYFVNPSSIKVTKLMFQLSLLAVKTILQRDIGKKSVKEQSKDLTDKYKSKDFSHEHFNELVDSSTKQFVSKVLNHQNYKKEMESIAALMKQQIIENETEYKNKMDVVNKHIDSFLAKHKFEGEEKKVIKRDIQQEDFFGSRLLEVDKELDALENSWNSNTQSLLDSSRNCLEIASSLVARYMGEADKKSYMMEYDHEQDKISTAPLEAVSSSTEIHILRNITNDRELNFPNLIKGFVIAVCHIFKNTNFSDDTYHITQYLGSSHAKVFDILSGLRTVMKDFVAAQDRLESLRPAGQHPEDIERSDMLLSIPPLPDLTIKFPSQFQVATDGYTPLNINRRQFHIHRKISLTDNLLYRQPPRSLITTPFHSGLQNDIFKSVTTIHATDRRLVQNRPSQLSTNVNETVAGDATGFTKQQILRLLSTKKSSVKKARSQKNREDIKIRGDLFNKSNDGAGLFRSHSSPNLYEGREKRQLTNARMTLLSPMQEVIHSPLDISGIVALENNSKDHSPLQLLNFDVNVLPDIIISPIENGMRSKVNLMNFEAINLEMTPEKQIKCEAKSRNVECVPSQITPTLMSHPIRKTSSMEKLINRYKRVRETAVAGRKEITEEAVKENIFEAADDMLDISDDIQYKPRQSLGTVLGVDNTFLDQFDLID